jgi:CelD/BcsL family acetyltransferase involved in cellulose biosynthesis
VRRAVEALGREGRARLVRLDVGERLGAFHLALVWGTRAVVYKTAFDRGLAGLPGLGWSSLLALIDRLAAEGVRSIDLGPWGGAYKSHVADAEATVTLRLPLSPAGRIYLMAAAATRGAARRRRAT